MKLNCKHVWSYLSDFIDGSVSPEEQAAIELHLEHCETCSAILDSMRNILALTADERVFTLPLGFSERLHARIAEELKTASKIERGDGAPDASS